MVKGGDQRKQDKRKGKMKGNNAHAGKTKACMGQKSNREMRATENFYEDDKNWNSAGRQRDFSLKTPSSMKNPKHYLNWLDDPDRVMNHIEKYNIGRLLDKGDGIVKIKNFLPTWVAEGALMTIEGISDKEWNATEAGQDQEHNNISHKFWSIKHAECLEPLTRAIGCLAPEQFNTFSAAKYIKSNHIVPHDDRQYTEVTLEDGSLQTCCREIAIIYYLTKDWKEEMGGVLVDCPTGTRYVPEFNSLIAFRIPRFHEVEAVKANRPRYSIFGWLLSEKILYDLNTKPVEELDEEIKQSEPSQIEEPKEESEIPSPKEPFEVSENDENSSFSLQQVPQQMPVDTHCPLEEVVQAEPNDDDGEDQSDDEQPENQNASQKKTSKAKARRLKRERALKRKQK